MQSILTPLVQQVQLPFARAIRASNVEVSMLYSYALSRLAEREIQRCIILEQTARATDT